MPMSLSTIGSIRGRIARSWRMTPMVEATESVLVPGEVSEQAASPKDASGGERVRARARPEKMRVFDRIIVDCG